MEKIESVTQLEDCLHAHLILCMIDKKGVTYMMEQKEKIWIQNANARFVLTLDDFLKLYQGQVFYIYDNEEALEISLEKDQEYYAWQHK